MLAMRQSLHNCKLINRYFSINSNTFPVWSRVRVKNEIAADFYDVYVSIQSLDSKDVFAMCCVSAIHISHYI